VAIGSEVLEAVRRERAMFGLLVGVTLDFCFGVTMVAAVRFDRRGGMLNEMEELIIHLTVVLQRRSSLVNRPTKEKQVPEFSF